MSNASTQIFTWASILRGTQNMEHNNKGDMIGIIGFSEDITARRLSEEKVEQSRTLLQNIFDGISEPIIVIDQNMVLMMANKTALEYTHCTRTGDAIAGKPCFEVLRGRTSPCEGCGVAERLGKGENVSFERKGVMDSSQLEQVSLHFFRKDEKKAIMALSFVSVTSQK
ncbi:MAG TPA: PAS domain-containing protein [Desulfobacteraceae bacterium]|nr:PAS domain-containing protein [Desulfobacteraceae bacterium]